MNELSVRIPPKPGTTIAGRYELVRPLPASALGWRFLALDTALETTPVQITLLYPHHVAQSETLERIQQEILATRQLVHPNIAQIFDFDFAETGQPFICSEFLRGVTLRSLLSRNTGSRIPEDETLQVLAPVAQALAYAHRKGTVHGGVSPEVIHILDSGIVKITDFGCARALHSSNGLTRTGETAFLPEYQAPEQIMQAEADPRSDLYAFGCIAYEMLTGSPPFRDDSFLRLTELHKSTPAAELPLRKWSSPWFADIVLTCCTPLAADRTLTAEQIATHISVEFKSTSRADFLRTAASSGTRRRSKFIPSWQTVGLWIVILLLTFWLFDQNTWRPSPVTNFLKLERAFHTRGIPIWTLYPVRRFLQIEASLVDHERNFHLGIRHQEVDCASLADQWYDISVKNSDGTPLVHLIGNDINLHGCLLYGVRARNWAAYLDMADGRGNTALHVAALRGDAVSAAQIANLGGDILRPNLAGDTPLGIALGRLDRPVLQEFVRLELSSRIPWGQPTLIYKYLETRDPLIAAIALNESVGIRPLRDGTTPLMYAIKLGLDPDVYQLLINDPLRANRTQQGEDALFIAIKRDSVQWVKALLKSGLSPRTHNIDGDTPLHLAVRNGSPAIVQALMLNGALPDTRDGRGRTPADISREIDRADLTSLIESHDATAHQPSAVSKPNPAEVG